MWQEGRLLQRVQRLERLHRVLVMVRMPLQFKQQVVSKSMRGIPTVKNRHLFILAAGKFLPLQP